jgi:hypothetical protein
LLVISTLWIHVLGKKDFVIAFGYTGFTSLKTSHPCGFPL